jgi:membrane-associated protease RseP (regulator of RpoE activity)
MKRSLIILIALTLAATTLVAQDRRTPERFTIISRDGKLLELDGQPLLGGKRTYLGVTTTDLTADLREHFGASKDAGVLVGSVEDNSPADKAGVRVGDILVSADGKDVKSLGDIRRALREKKDGDTLRLEVLRGKSRQTLVATVTEKEFDLPRVLRNVDPELFNRRIPLGEQWNTRVFAMPNCEELQTRIKDLEGRLKDLEKKLQK